MSFDWKSIVKSVAPMLGAALPGPLGAMASTAIARALGVNQDEKTLAMTISGATTEQLAAIQKAEQDFKLQMEKMGIENVQALEKIAAEDRSSAREREIKTGDVWTPRILAGVVVLGWLGAQAFLLRHIVDPAMRDIIMRMLGTLDAALTMVLAYYFGSSSSSRVKDELLYRSTPTDGGQK